MFFIVFLIFDDDISIRIWKYFENKLNSWIRWENVNLIENVRLSLIEFLLRLVNIVGFCIFLLRFVVMKEKICYCFYVLIL